MASTVPPIRGAAYTTYISLVSRADTGLFATTVTLAAGDVVVYKDGGLDGNIDTLPVEIGTTGILNVTLSATEMTADQIVVRFRDAAGSEWQDALIVIHTAAQSLNTMDTNIDSILDDTGTAGVIVASLEAAAAATVNAQVVDALATDTYAEPGQESPGATVSLSTKISYLYKAFRNKITQTATTLSIYNDAEAVVDQKATVSDDATTYTRGEIGTGP